MAIPIVNFSTTIPENIRLDLLYSLPSDEWFRARDRLTGPALYANAIGCHREAMGRLPQFSKFNVGWTLWTQFAREFSQIPKPRFLELRYGNIILHIGTTTSFEGAVSNAYFATSSLFVIQTEPTWTVMNAFFVYQPVFFNLSFKKILPKDGPGVNGKEILHPLHGLQLTYYNREELVRIDNVGIADLWIRGVGTFPYELFLPSRN